MNLFQPALQPVQLSGRDASLGTTAGAGSVERDESHGRQVVNVVGRPDVEVLLLESMARRLAAGPQVRVQEFAEDELAPVTVRRHIDVWTRHENFGSLNELLDHRVEVDSIRKAE